jgi:hypothetical protein
MEFDSHPPMIIDFFNMQNCETIPPTGKFGRDATFIVDNFFRVVLIWSLELKNFRISKIARDRIRKRKRSVKRRTMDGMDYNWLSIWQSPLYCTSNAG